MSSFRPNPEGVRQMMEQVGRQRGEQYRAVDAAARKDQADHPLDVPAREAWLRRELTGAGLPELTNMEGWAQAIVSAKDFELRINVQ